MFQAFSPEYNKSIANGLTGGVVSLMILITGISMIVTANKKLKEMEVKDEVEKWFSIQLCCSNKSGA